MPNRDTCCGPSVDDEQFFSWESGDGFVSTYDRQARRYYVNTVLLPDSHPDMGKLIAALREDVDYSDDRDPATGLFNYENVYTRLERACTIYMSRFDCSDGFVWDIFLARPDVGMGTDAFIGMLGAVGQMGAFRMAGASAGKPVMPGQALCGRNSFTGETLVLMADGSTKRIDQIAVGEEVAAGEPESAVVEGHVVTAVIVTDADKDYVDLTISTPEGEKIVRSTAHHPFYNASTREWVDAGLLHAGEELSTHGRSKIMCG